MSNPVMTEAKLDVIHMNGMPWIKSSQISAALGYSNKDGARVLYKRHKDEFTENMTATIDLPTNGGIQRVNIFSLRGCWLLGMLSRTKKAKDFRLYYKIYSKFISTVLLGEKTNSQKRSITE